VVSQKRKKRKKDLCKKIAVVSPPGSGVRGERKKKSSDHVCQTTALGVVKYFTDGRKVRLRGRFSVPAAAGERGNLRRTVSWVNWTSKSATSSRELLAQGAGLRLEQGKFQKTVGIYEDSSSFEKRATPKGKRDTYYPQGRKKGKVGKKIA